MNRRAIRDLAAKDLGLKTARTATRPLRVARRRGGGHAVRRQALMSSRAKAKASSAPKPTSRPRGTTPSKARGDLAEIIVEAFIDFDYEITLLT